MNKIIELDVVDSTQTYIKQNTNTISYFDSCFAKAQTAGYGRSGNWDSSFENLYFSKLLPVDDYNHLTAICSAHMLLSKYSDQIEINVPNDLFAGNVKLGGVLIENIDDRAILGIGLNINGSPEQFNSLSKLTNKRYDIEEFVNELDNLINLNLTMSVKMLEEYYKANCKLIGKQVDCVDKSSDYNFSGTVTNLDSNNIWIDNIKYNQMQIKILNK